MEIEYRLALLNRGQRLHVELTCGFELFQIWVKLANTPRAKEQELLKEVFKAWYTMGRLSAYNGMNLQARH